MKIMVNDKEIFEVTTNRSLTIADAMYVCGYDITDAGDCKKGYDNDIEGFYLDDCGNYSFDVEAAEMVY